jgi:murein L,D-transpeptidase YafK
VQYPDKKLLNFWAQLKLGYFLFEKNRKIPEVFIHSNGAYDFVEK